MRVEHLTTARLRALKVDPDCAIFPVFNDEERAGLRESMQVDGFDPDMPVTVNADTNEIEDGRNRRDVACELEIDGVPVVYRHFADRAEKLRFIARRNIHRRNLTAAQRRSLAGKLSVDGGLSTREAAKLAGVSQMTAQRAATEQREASGESDDSRDQVTGADGKRYRATRTKKSKPKRETVAQRLRRVRDAQPAADAATAKLAALLVGCTVRGKTNEGKVRTLTVTSLSLDREQRLYVFGSDKDGSRRTMLVDEISSIVKLAEETAA